MYKGTSGVRQTEFHTAEPFVPEPSASEVAFRKLKRYSYKLPGNDQIQAGGKYCILRYIKILCWSGTKKHCKISSSFGREYEAQNLLGWLLCSYLDVNIQLRTRQYIPEDSELQRSIASSVERINCRTYSQKGNATDCSNYRGILLLSTSYKMLSNILLSRLIPYANEVTGDDHCGLWHNRSTDQIFISIRYWRKSGSIMVQYIMVSVGSG
jgi:hypothetical protein